MKEKKRYINNNRDREIKMQRKERGAVKERYREEKEKYIERYY
jgi:hypothetical protein